MQEQFPDKKSPGDDLYAKEITDVFSVCSRVSRLFPGGNTTGLHTRSFNLTGVQPQGAVYPVEITDEVTDANGDTIDSLFLCVTRYYDPDEGDNGEWKSSINPDNFNDPNATKWLLDARGVDSSLSVGSWLSAWWHEFRGAFIPAGAAGLTPFYLAEDLSAITHTADANPATWDGTANSGWGEYTADTSRTETVLDPGKSLTGGSGKFAYCQRQSCSNGIVWCIVSIDC